MATQINPAPDNEDSVVPNQTESVEPMNEGYHSVTNTVSDSISNIINSDNNLHIRVSEILENFNTTEISKTCFNLIEVDDFIDDCFEENSDEHIYYAITSNNNLQDDLNKLFKISIEKLEFINIFYKNMDDYNYTSYVSEYNDGIIIAMIIKRYRGYLKNIIKFKREFLTI